MWVTWVTVSSWVLPFHVVLWYVNAGLYAQCGKCSVSAQITHFWCTVWKVFCFCVHYMFLMYRLEYVLFLCTVSISGVASQNIMFVCTVLNSYVPPGKCSVSVHRTHFDHTVWEVLCFCVQHTFLKYRLKFFCTEYISYVPFGNVLLLCTVQISYVPSEMCSFSVHRTHFWCTVWNVFLCNEYSSYVPFGNVLLLCTVQISYVPSEPCSFSVHRTHFWFIVWNLYFCAQNTFLMYRSEMFCSCAEYKFLMHRLKCVLFPCTEHISDVPSGKCSFLCTLYTFPVYRLENIVFLCTIHMSSVLSWKCSVCVHSRHF
jgi:hypothetical protein